MKVINARLRGRTGLFTIECVQGKFSANSAPSAYKKD